MGFMNPSMGSWFYPYVAHIFKECLVCVMLCVCSPGVGKAGSLLGEMYQVLYASPSAGCFSTQPSCRPVPSH